MDTLLKLENNQSMMLSRLNTSAPFKWLLKVQNLPYRIDPCWVLPKWKQALSILIWIRNIVFQEISISRKSPLRLLNKTKKIGYEPVTLQQKKQPKVREKHNPLCMSKASYLQSQDSVKKISFPLYKSY